MQFFKVNRACVMLMKNLWEGMPNWEGALNKPLAINYFHRKGWPTAIKGFWLIGYTGMGYL